MAWRRRRLRPGRTSSTTLTPCATSSMPFSHSSSGRRAPITGSRSMCPDSTSRSAVWKLEARLPRDPTSSSSLLISLSMSTEGCSWKNATSTIRPPLRSSGATPSSTPAAPLHSNTLCAP